LTIAFAPASRKKGEVKRPVGWLLVCPTSEKGLGNEAERRWNLPREEKRER